MMRLLCKIILHDISHNVMQKLLHIVNKLLHVFFYGLLTKNFFCSKVSMFNRTQFI